MIPLLLILVIAALPCFAGEVAVLKNGFSIRHERRQVIGNTTRLFMTADGSSFVDVPTSEIEHYEAAPDPTQGPLATALSQPSKSQTSGSSASRSISFPIRPNTDLSEVVSEASTRYRLDPDLVNSVIKAESGFNAHAISPKGAQGLMQLMPGTATELGVPNPFDPAANVDGGTRYLRELMERYNFDIVKALAAYNAGPQRVEQYGGVPPYYETRAYVARIVKDFNKKKIAQRKTAAAQKTQTARGAKPSATSQHKSTSAGQTRALAESAPASRD